MIAASIAVCVAWVVTLPRLVPGTFGDHGTFISVAERMLAGDRLYVDVWDNKDPLFYYALALGRLASPLADVLLEILWVLGAAISVLVLARAAGARPGLAMVAGLGATPLLLTGPAYEAGMTHLPGLAVLLGAVACAVRSRWVVAGVLVGLLMLTKLILAPVVAGALLVVALHRRETGGLGGLLRAALSAVVLLAAGIAVMWLRGELPGWVDNFRLNADYAQGDLAASQYGSLIGHLLRAFPEDGRGAGSVTIAALVIVLLAVQRSTTRAVPVERSATDGGDEDAAIQRTISPAVLWDLTLVSLVLALVVIAATATWPHHAQSLSAPGAFALALLATRLGGVIAGGRAAALLLVAGYAMAGALHPYFYLTAARGVPTSLQLQRQSPESVVMASLPQVHTYARAGTNDVSAHAVGLRGLTLSCARFHQYSLDSAEILQSTADCLPRADALIVDDSLRPEVGQPAWNAYVAKVRELVANRYDCVRAGAADICMRRTT
ncbi:hypothetical protein GCM10009826_47430 [Humibacillus xanthopallidus]